MDDASLRDGILTYNGTVYRLHQQDLPDLLARGVVVADRTTPGRYELGSDHVIEEIGADPTILGHRTGAEARGEGDDIARQRMLAVRYMHRDGQGGGH